jgi:hypothetical protein
MGNFGIGKILYYVWRFQSTDYEDCHLVCDGMCLIDLFQVFWSKMLLHYWALQCWDWVAVDGTCLIDLFQVFWSKMLLHYWALQCWDWVAIDGTCLIDLLQVFWSKMLLHYWALQSWDWVAIDAPRAFIIDCFLHHAAVCCQYESNRFLWNIATCLPKYTPLHPSIHWPSLLSLWDGK